MRVFLLAAAALAAGLLFPQTFSTSYPDRLEWGHSGVQRSSQNVSDDGALNLQSVLNNQRTGFELRPTTGTQPTGDARAEFVEYLRQTGTSGENFERMNWSAMASPDGVGDHYRFGVEKGGTGCFRRVTFAFENTAPGDWVEPLVFWPPGVASPTWNASNRVIIDPAAPSGSQTPLWLLCPGGTGNTLKRVELGPADSGGAGYRTLRVAN